MTSLQKIFWIAPFKLKFKPHVSRWLSIERRHDGPYAGCSFYTITLYFIGLKFIEKKNDELILALVIKNA